MTTAKSGDAVKVHYTGRLLDGTIFDSSEGREPLEFVLGQGMMIQGFEEGVFGMAQGDTKTIQMSPEKAYGFANPEMIFAVPRQEIPAELPLEIGMTLMANLGDGEEVPVIVKSVTTTEVTLDANHPLAGETLVFEVKLMEIAGGQPKSRIITDF